MSKKYLDKDGLTYFWGKVKNEIPDLTNYVTKTDYASSSTGGVIKTNSAAGNYTAGSGILYANVKTYSDYANFSDNGFISKGTLENVITGKGLLDSGDLKTINSTSVVGSGNIDTKEVHISTTAPTDDTVIWIDPNEVVTRQEMSIKTTYNDSDNNAYSTHYVNSQFNELFTMETQRKDITLSTTWSTVTVTYNKTYTEAPMVFATLESSTNKSAFIGVYNRSTTGCSIRYMSQSNTGAAYLNILIIGK